MAEKHKEDIKGVDRDYHRRPTAKFLSENSLHFHDDVTEKPRPDVPPTSPKELIFDYSFTSLPKLFPRLADLKLPYIREVGIKAAIEQLAEYFQCKDYKFNLIQFWFLDIITDCLWRAQDEFQFPEEHQKIILEWVLYIFNLIRAHHLNLSKKKLFVLFKEAMIVAEDYVQSGCPQIPLPEELFSLNLEEDENQGESDTLYSSGSCTSTDSTLSLHSSSGASSYVAVKLEDNMEYFKLPMKTCTWGTDEEDECMSTSVETASELEVPQEILEKKETEVEEEQEEDVDFYKPDRKIPARFVPSRISFGFSISISFESESIEYSDASKDATWVDVPRHPPKSSCPSELTAKKEIVELPVQTEKTKKDGKEPIKPQVVEPPPDDLKNEEVLQAWFDYHLWQQRIEAMGDPSKGWVAPQSDTDENITQSVTLTDADETEAAKKEWVDYIKKRKEQTKEMEENIFINTCVLLAIKQFIFDYFYETFLFTLLKIAFRSPHHLITQEINEKWYVPKILKGDLKKPKPKKPKKEKKPKKPPKPKAPKKGKPGKDKSKSKSSKGSKDKKKEKPKPLTKEEKAELARLKREQELLEEEKRKAEENRRFMFPLAEAATEDFFKSIFEGWVKIEGKKGKGKKGKDQKKKK